MQAQVKALGDKAVTKQVHKDAAEVVLDLADRTVPDRSGGLRRTGRAAGQQNSGTVRYGTKSKPYAGPVHFGHLNRPQGGYVLPNPWLFDAADQRREEVFDKFRE